MKKKSSSRGAKLLKALAVLVVLTLVGGIVARVLYQEHVVDNPGEHLRDAHIRSLITQESPVYYRDGQTPIGVFFDEEHRQYVTYEEIPQDWVNAIVSAEDQRYWTHPGVDLEGLARAMKQNIQAGRVVSGGSTLTMQTSENLFHPGTFTLKGKLWEVLDTLRLEEHYSKEQILEFYANQFHVYGNGRGLGIAARYFFDKDVSDLTLHESAFLAGLVKIPGRYNPFIGTTEEARQTAREKAVTRTDYVLGRMKDEGHITPLQYGELKGKPVPFKKGEFRFASSVVMDEVQRQLELAPFPEILLSAGIDNPSTAGIQVITTLDEPTQRAATYGLWHHLSGAGTSLEGMETFTVDSSRLGRPDRDNPPQRFDFHYAKVTGTAENGDTLLDVGGFDGRLDKEARLRGATILKVAKTGDRTQKGQRLGFNEGDVLWVSIREKKEDVYLCDVEVRPELQGAVVVLEDGQVRALVGGNDNRNFNRASEAKRQFGSTWKILVYDAAMQLGWAPTDTLDNRRQVFPFSGTWYYPRPDHASEDFVSMAWAGVRSENLATIWLLYHLTDRLNREQVRRLAELTDLAQREDETYDAYVARIRDTHGIISTRNWTDDAAFLAVREEVIAGLPFSGRPEDAVELRSMHYGRGFAKERSRQSDPRRLKTLENNFLELEELAQRCKPQHEALLEAAKPPKKTLLDPFRMKQPQPKTTTLAPSEVDLLWARFDAQGIELICADREPAGAFAVGEDLIHRLDAPGLPKLSEDPKVGRVHLSTLEATRRAMDRKRATLDLVDPYEPEFLYLHPDFRLTLGMKYLSLLAAEYGVQTDLPPVLSMPLGAVDVSLLEAAGIYQGFLGGQSWDYPGQGFEPSSVPGLRSSFDVPDQEVPQLLIAEIRDRDGNVLYRAEPEPIQVADPVAGVQTTDILKNVVQHGTGRGARWAAPGHGLGGKTGTTNEFKNAAFLGHAPGETTVYTVASYVGYDDNRPMSRGNIRLQGASGAMPAWAGTIYAMDQLGRLGDEPPEQDLDGDWVRVNVVDKSGLPGGDDPERSVLLYGTEEGPTRRFAPLTDRAEEQDEKSEALPEEGVDTSEPIDPRLRPSIWDQIEEDG